MNEVKVAELINLKIDYNMGQMQDIHFRCNLIGPFLLDIGNFSEDLQDAAGEWLDLCDKYNLELFESLIEIHTDGTMQGEIPRLSEQFPEEFDKLTDFLLGKIDWQPPQIIRDSVELSARKLTADKLDHIYYKS